MSKLIKQFNERSSNPVDKNIAATFDIVDSLLERSGFDGWWYDVDDETKNEILEEIRDTINKHFEPDLT